MLREVPGPTTPSPERNRPRRRSYPSGGGQARPHHRPARPRPPRRARLSIRRGTIHRLREPRVAVQVQTSKPSNIRGSGLTSDADSSNTVQSNDGAGGDEEDQGRAGQPRLPARQERPEAGRQAQERRSQASPLPAVGQAAPPSRAQARGGVVSDAGARGVARVRSGRPPAPAAGLSRDPAGDADGGGARPHPRRAREHPAQPHPPAGRGGQRAGARAGDAGAADLGGAAAECCGDGRAAAERAAARAGVRHAVPRRDHPVAAAGEARAGVCPEQLAAPPGAPGGRGAAPGADRSLLERDPLRRLGGTGGVVRGAGGLRATADGVAELLVAQGRMEEARSAGSVSRCRGGSMAEAWRRVAAIMPAHDRRGFDQLPRL